MNERFFVYSNNRTTIEIIYKTDFSSFWKKVILYHFY